MAGYTCFADRNRVNFSTGTRFRLLLFSRSGYNRLNLGFCCQLSIQIIATSKLRLVMERNDATNNPLLITDGLPRFDLIRPEHVVPAVRQVLKTAETKLAELERNYQPTWEGLLHPLEELDTPFDYCWSPVLHLLGVKNSPELRKAHETVLPEVITFSLRVRQSPELYQGLKTIKDGPIWNHLSSARQRVVEQKLKAAMHAGVGLEGETKRRFITLENELSKLATEFSNHVLDATKAFHLDITERKDTEGWPRTLKQVAAQSFKLANPDFKTPVTPDCGPWRITLDLPSSTPFLQHSRNRDQRKAVYHAQITRASEGDWDNTALINRILELKEEKARVLGFNTYAELSLDSKMAPGVVAVEKMFDELIRAAKPFAEKEFGEVAVLAKAAGQHETIRQWDWPFWSERLREKQFDYTDDLLRPYFQLPKVLNGLFSVAGNLFGVFIELETGEYPAWHPDVRLFRVRDQTGTLRASFYLDPFSRPQEKRGGAWMSECLNRKTIAGKVRLPVIHVCCNSTPPVGNTPSLLSFREVETLFHEFGHALQGMLTEVNEADAAGTNGVEWDAVELPSQFMENWCYHKPTLVGMTEHFETGEPLPDDLFEKIKRSKTFQSGYLTMRQVLFGVVDLHLHHYFTTKTGTSPFAVYSKLARELSVFEPYPQDRLLCSFNHIFAGGYSAGYYSYKWAEVLSADAFAAFEEAGLDDLTKLQKTGRKFRDTVLALGGSRHPLEVFKLFRGREPSTEALMRHSGFKR